MIYYFINNFDAIPAAKRIGDILEYLRTNTKKWTNRRKRKKIKQIKGNFNELRKKLYTSLDIDHKNCFDTEYIIGILFLIKHIMNNYINNCFDLSFKINNSTIKYCYRFDRHEQYNFFHLLVTDGNDRNGFTQIDIFDYGIPSVSLVPDRNQYETYIAYKLNNSDTVNEVTYYGRWIPENDPSKVLYSHFAFILDSIISYTENYLISLVDIEVNNSAEIL